MLPVLHTFVHFSCQPRAGSSRRSRSCPPEFNIDVALSQARSRESRARKREQAARKKVARKLARLVSALRVGIAKTMLEESKSIIGARKIERSTPRPREALVKRVYTEFAHRVFSDKRDELMLQCMGVIREKGDNVEFWCADDPLDHPTMQALLDQARRCREVYESGCFQVVMVEHAPLVFRFRHCVTLELLRNSAHRHFRIAAGKQRLEHLGHPLKIGALCDQGIGPGSIVCLSRK